MASNEDPLPERAVQPGTIEAASERLEAYLKNRQLPPPAGECPENLSSSDEARPISAGGGVVERQTDEAELGRPTMARDARRIAPFWIKAALAIALLVAAAEGAYIAWSARSTETSAPPLQSSTSAGRSTERRRPEAPTVEGAKAGAADERARVQAPAGGDAAPSAARAPGAAGPPAAATTGTIDVRTTPPGATVVFRGRRRGVTPLTIPDVAPGVHDVEVGGWFGSRTQRVAVRPGRTTVLDLPVPRRP